LNELYELSKSKGLSKPSGVLLTGCPGVGKTRLASCLANKMIVSSSLLSVHWISCHDLISKASWASDSQLLDLLLPSKVSSLFVLDDLQALKRDDDTGSRDFEYLLVRSTIMLAIDRLSFTDTFTLGICRAKSDLPPELTCVGRFEKEIKMNHPMQVQRQSIIQSFLPSKPEWVSALTKATAGFVANDLHRIYTDAWTRAAEEDITWSDLRKAVYHTVPSQLTQLDVTRPQSLLLSVEEDDRELHNQAWSKFGGYPSVKKRLYRTVVYPWRRQLESNEEMAFGLAPPRGVLFHGTSGVGKTFAAKCLCTSLQLNVIEVKASDVLDQWLGGSEAMIRSLFERARGASPCVLFFDEIDAIACNRNNQDEGCESDVSSRILTTLLNELDGISSNKKDTDVLLLACTNRFEDIDPALLRPGRLDEHVELLLPNYQDVKAILTLYLSHVPMEDTVQLSQLAETLCDLGVTGADVEGICRDVFSQSTEEDNSSTSDLWTRALTKWKQPSS